MPPDSKAAARRLLILLAINSHALRLMMIWDFVFRTAEALQRLTGQSTAWNSLGLRGEWMKLRAEWNWWWERRAMKGNLKRAELWPHLTQGERKFLGMGLSPESRERASCLVWQIEGAGCIAWALRLVPRLWPMDEPFDGKMDFTTLASLERRLVETAELRPMEEIQNACRKAQAWHWRARQLKLERTGFVWPPAGATPEEITDLQAKGLGTLSDLTRTSIRSLHEHGIVDEILDDELIARGQAYRQLSDQDASELLGLATERHRGLNWLCGSAPNNDWGSVPVET